MTYMNDTPSPVQFKAYRFLFYACFICYSFEILSIMSGEGKEHAMRVMRYPIGLSTEYIHQANIIHSEHPPYPT